MNQIHVSFSTVSANAGGSLGIADVGAEASIAVESRVISSLIALVLASDFDKLSNVGFNKIALVTHYWHMPRGMKAFQHVGFEVTPAPMGFVSGNNWELMTLIPQSSALSSTFTIFRELVALLVQGQ